MEEYSFAPCQGRHFIIIKTQWFGNLSDATQLPCLAKCQMHNVHSHPQLCEHVSKVILLYEGKFALSSSIIKKKEKKSIIQINKKTQGAETIAIFLLFFQIDV